MKPFLAANVLGLNESFGVLAQQAIICCSLTDDLTLELPEKTLRGFSRNGAGTQSIETEL